MCADESTVCTDALSVNELNGKHKKELKLVSDWVTNNKLVFPTTECWKNHVYYNRMNV